LTHLTIITTTSAIAAGSPGNGNGTKGNAAFAATLGILQR